MKRRISNYLKRKNVKRFSIFFALAFLFLIFSKLSNDYKQTIKLKISLQNLDEEVIVENDSLNFINAYVEAKGFTLAPFLFKNSKEIFVNAKQDVLVNSKYIIFDIQKNRYIIEDQLGTSYKVISLKPDTLRLKYSKMATKFVGVIINEDIKYASGFDLLGNLKKEKDSVKIVGPTSELNKIEKVETELLELSEVKSNINVNLNLVTSEFNKVDVFPKSIMVNGLVKRFTEGTLEVPVNIINTPKNTDINYFPKTVSVSYYVDLERFKSVKSSDFKVECDFAALDENQQFLTPKIIRQPDYVKRVGIKQKRIDFIKL